MSRSFYFKKVPRLRTVRLYKGEEVPWVPHDCDETERCAFCRNAKRQFAKAKKAELPTAPEVLAPFLNAAKRIPRNWPDEVILTFDKWESNRPEVIGYRPADDEDDGITIRQWRDLLQAYNKPASGGS